MVWDRGVLASGIRLEGLHNLVCGALSGLPSALAEGLTLLRAQESVFVLGLCFGGLVMGSYIRSFKEYS